ncbi:MAG: 4Fe-4S dicluster domain-containing protein [Kiritimatiellae bacterium]|nr:4Fe-4S dicluster domain-containing protein [Kiritimatiellia bacterium]MBR6586478.1 4Fe-4S dicluster domain-containing protein [Kiritimatiellia bacterium]
MRSSSGCSGRRGFFARLMDSGPALPTDGIFCSVCGYCMPCPYGVDIPGIFSLYNDAVDAKDSCGRKFLKTYEETIPYLRQANHCIECGICLSQCPMSVDIPKEMRRIDELVESFKVKELMK